MCCKKIACNKTQSWDLKFEKQWTNHRTNINYVENISICISYSQCHHLKKIMGPPVIKLGTGPYPLTKSASTCEYDCSFHNGPPSIPINVWKLEQVSSFLPNRVLSDELLLTKRIIINQKGSFWGIYIEKEWGSCENLTK